MAGKRGFTKVPLALPKEGNVGIFTSAAVAATIKRTIEEATLFEGVKLLQALEAVYNQGKKDGARAAFAHLDAGVAEAKKQVKYKNPGRARLAAPAKPAAAAKKRKRTRKKRRPRA